MTDRQTVGTGTDPQPLLRSLTKLRPRSARARGRAPRRLTSGLGVTAPHPRRCRGALGVVVVAVVVLDACGGGGVGGGGVVQPDSRVPLGPLSRLPPAWCRSCRSPALVTRRQTVPRCVASSAPHRATHTCRPPCVPSLAVPSLSRHASRLSAAWRASCTRARPLPPRGVSCAAAPRRSCAAVSLLGAPSPGGRHRCHPRA